MELVVFRRELVDVLEDVLLGARQSAQEVLTLLRRQQLHDTLQLVDADVVCHYAAATHTAIKTDEARRSPHRALTLHIMRPMWGH